MRLLSLVQPRWPGKFLTKQATKQLGRTGSKLQPVLLLLDLRLQVKGLGSL